MRLLGGHLSWADDAPRPSEDAFWLAASVPPLPNTTSVLDMGCGAGAVGLALLTRQPHVVLHGIDSDSAMVAHAQQNAALNARRAQFTTADIAHHTPAALYPVIVCNPPFHAVVRGHTAASARKRLAHSLPAAGLSPWVNAWARCLAPGGRVYLVLHAALATELATCGHVFGGSLRLAPLASHPSRPPKRMLGCWAPDKTKTFQLITENVVPIHHTPLRLNVLQQGGSLTALLPGW